MKDQHHRSSSIKHTPKITSPSNTIKNFNCRPMQASKQSVKMSQAICSKRVSQMGPSLLLLLLLCFSLALVMIPQLVHCRGQAQPVSIVTRPPPPLPQAMSTQQANQYNAAAAAAGRPQQHHKQHQYQQTVMNTPPSQQFQVPLVSSQQTNYFGRYNHRVVALHHQPVQQQQQQQPAPNNYHHRQHQQQQPSRHYQVPSMCQIQEHQKPYSKCLGRNDAHLNGSALAEFRSRLDETSSDLRQLLELHLGEFRALSLGVILLARNDTLNKLHENQPAPGPSANWAQMSTLATTKRLFDSMHAHLLSYHQLTSGSSASDMFATTRQQFTGLSGFVQRPGGTARASMDLFGQEIVSYFKKLHLIQLKQMLDASLMASTSPQRVLDFQCLERNLATQTDVERVLDELVIAASAIEPTSSSTADNEAQTSQYYVTPAQNYLDQARLATSLKQSIEFARTLLGSLSLSAEMLNNITRRMEEWMPSQACHAALAQMTVCQECHVSSSSSSISSPDPFVSMPPCENYCLNVARGCMNDLYELNRFWVEHLQALARFRTNMIQTNNIENVMSSLDGKLLGVITRIRARYAIPSGSLNLSSSNNKSSNSYDIQDSATRRSAILRLDQLPLSSELVKRCPRDQPELAQQHPTPATPTVETTQQHQTGFLSGLWRTNMVDVTVNQPPAPRPAGRPATKMLPATQQRPFDRQMMEVAQRARQSSDLSLFNRLHGLVLQLQGSRNFFIDWPQQVCQRMRRTTATSQSSTISTANNNNLGDKTGARGAQNGANVANNTGLTTSVCWNGHDFSGYNKQLAEFGSPISANHPEVAVPQPQPISTTILDLVARLKEVGARLMKLSVRSPVSPIDLASLTSKLARGTNNNRPITSSSAGHYEPAAAPSAAAQVSRAELRDDEQASQQQQQQGQLMALVGNSDLTEHDSQTAPLGADDPDLPGSTGAEDPEAPNDDSADGDGDDDSSNNDDGDDDGHEAGEDDHNDDSGSSNSANQQRQDEQDEDEQDLPPCKTDDCSDLVLATTTQEIGGQQLQNENHPNHHEQTNNNNVQSGAGSTNAWDVNNVNNHVPYHPHDPYQTPSSSSSVNSMTADGMVAGYNQATPMVNINSRTGQQQPRQQQQPSEIYPIENPTGTTSGAASAGSPFVMVAQLNGLAGWLALVHLLLACYNTLLITVPRQRSLMLVVAE